MSEKPSSLVQGIRSEGGATIVALHGDLDMRSAPTLRNEIGKIVAGRPGRLVLNFTQVNYIDSTGLGTLVYFLRQVNTYGGKMMLVGLSTVVKNVFEITRLLNVFNIHETDEAAIKS